ncbi:MAG: hypothetical protein ABJB85_12045 [Nitrososphaerota archaeon]
MPVLNQIVISSGVMIIFVVLYCGIISKVTAKSRIKYTEPEREITNGQNKLVYLFSNHVMNSLMNAQLNLVLKFHSTMKTMMYAQGFGVFFL